MHPQFASYSINSCCSKFSLEKMQLNCLVLNFLWEKQTQTKENQNCQKH